MWWRLKGENEGDEVGFERRESRFGEREERDRELHTTDMATGIFWAEGSEECFRVQLIRVFFFFCPLSLSLLI